MGICHVEYDDDNEDYYKNVIEQVDKLPREKTLSSYRNSIMIIIFKKDIDLCHVCLNSSQTLTCHVK